MKVKLKSNCVIFLFLILFSNSAPLVKTNSCFYMLKRLLAIAYINIACFFFQIEIKPRFFKRKETNLVNS